MRTEETYHKWLYNGVIHLLMDSSYPDRYYVMGHELPWQAPRSVIHIGPKAYKVSSLITVNKYEFLEEES